jgi:EAL domain-containing protein (putative c-di-GMP-specific phosphodiesterase class I)
LRDADVAMYRAKGRGRKRFEWFDQQLHTEALRLLDLESDLRRALSRNEFEPYFQAIVRLEDGLILGYEALLRWRHGERGLLVPADFLAVAEDSGAVEEIDWQLFERALDEFAGLGRGRQYVAVNVSGRHFRTPDFAGQFLNLLDRSPLSADRVRVEVTEGVLLENPDHVRRTLERLREAGVLAQLDDFGTGYSSLSYLHRFPLHALKIDRSFVTDLGIGASHGSGNGSGSQAVVRAILALARSLGLEVIAEGIQCETERQALLGMGCVMGQGFLFARPAGIAELAA